MVSQAAPWWCQLFPRSVEQGERQAGLLCFDTTNRSGTLCSEFILGPRETFPMPAFLWQLFELLHS